MRLESLLYVGGTISNGIRLRIEANKAISSIETTAGRTPGGKTQAAKVIFDFFTDCASKVSTLYDVTVAAFSGVTSATVTAVTTIKVVFPEVMDTTVTPLPAAFVVNNAGTVSGVAWGTAGDVGKLIITGTGYTAADTVTYTKPATNALRDRAGNQMATGVKTTV